MAALMAIVLALSGASVASAAEPGDKYIGYSNPYVYGVDPFDDESLDKFASYLFVAPGDTYEGVEKTQVPLPGQQVVYCFNASKMYPPSVNELEGDKIDGDRRLDESVEPLWKYGYGNLASRAIAPRNAQTIEQDVLRITYNGFDGQGHDRAGLKATLGLSDAQFYQATQRALWYFTDSRGIQSEVDLVTKAAEILAGVTTDPAINLQTPTKGTLELWESNQPGPKENRNTTGYQHLLGARFVDPETGEEIPEEPEEPQNPEPSTVTVTATPTVTVTPSTTVTETTTVTATTTPTVTESTTSVETTTATKSVPTTLVTTETTTATKSVPTTETETTTATKSVPTTETETESTTVTETAPATTVTETESTTVTETAPATTVTETESTTVTERTEVPTTVTERTEVPTTVLETTQVTTTETAPCPTVTVTETPAPVETPQPMPETAEGVTVEEKANGALVVIVRDRNEKVVERIEVPTGWNVEEGKVKEITPTRDEKGNIILHITFVDGKTTTINASQQKQVTKTGSSDNEVLQRCWANAKNSPIFWLLPVGILVAVGAPVINQVGGPVKEQMDRLNAEIAKQFQWNSQNNNNRRPAGHGGQGIERDNNRRNAGAGDIAAQVDELNRRLGQAFGSPEAQQAGGILAVVAALGATAGLMYYWCSNEPTEDGTPLLSSKLNAKKD